MSSLLDVLSAAEAARATRGPQPGRVVSYDAAACEASIDPLVLAPGASGVTLQQVPVLWPWGVTGPLAAGDLVLLVPCERDLSAWAQDNGAQAPAPSARRSSLADCVALPVWRPVPTDAQAVALASVLSALLSALQAWAPAISAYCGQPALVLPTDIQGVTKCKI